MLNIHVGTYELIRWYTRNARPIIVIYGIDTHKLPE